MGQGMGEQATTTPQHPNYPLDHPLHYRGDVENVMRWLRSFMSGHLFESMAPALQNCDYEENDRSRIYELDLQI